MRLELAEPLLDLRGFRFNDLELSLVGGGSLVPDEVDDFSNTCFQFAFELANDARDSCRSRSRPSPLDEDEDWSNTMCLSCRRCLSSDPRPVRRSVRCCQRAFLVHVVLNRLMADAESHTLGFLRRETTTSTEFSRQTPVRHDPHQTIFIDNQVLQH